ncbi:MAG TPA: cell division protein FtsL [Burkholderiales bacterium]|jgi:cell division protein FtsL|nr:cell division protein FtsL [Burkholderiales bacterium]
MLRLNLLLLVVLTLCALALITSQHQARKSFSELEREQARAQQIDIEWGQLQLEQSTWAMHTRIEKLAREKLRMRQPEQNHVYVLQGGGA